jgi:antirestriction protein ArdC
VAKKRARFWVVREERAVPHSASIYEDVTSRILAEMEAGVLPWAQPWANSGGGTSPFARPANASTAKHYSGINILILWGAGFERGYLCQHWLTFKQALALGGSVRKGERGTVIVHVDSFTPKTEKQKTIETGEDASAISFLKRYSVFNIAQCDLPGDVLTKAGIDPAQTIATPIDEALFDARMRCIMENSAADIRYGGDQAFYVPTRDYIQLPNPGAFFDSVNFNRTAAHELGHWTKHPIRLNRDYGARYGTKAYGMEELTAELCAAFVCASLGIQPTVRHADYLAAWIDIMRADSRAIFQAASQASKAADYLLAFEQAASASAQDIYSNTHAELPAATQLQAA